MNRRGFMKCVSAGALLGVSGCLGYTRTSPSDYELVRSGYTNGKAWIDVKYTGDEEGKVQYKLYIRDAGTYVEESNTEAEELTSGQTHRLSANMEDVIFDRETASVGMKIVNSEDPDSVGDIGSIRITE